MPRAGALLRKSNCLLQLIETSKFRNVPTLTILAAVQGLGPSDLISLVTQIMTLAIKLWGGKGLCVLLFSPSLVICHICGAYDQISTLMFSQ